MQPAPIVDIHLGTARRIAATVQGNAVLLAALIVLRATPEAERAVAAVLELRDIRMLCTSWQLFDELTVDAGGADAWLWRVADAGVVNAARAALFDNPTDARP